MSAILTFVPRNQNVSPSTTQVTLRPSPQIENVSVDRWAHPADVKPQTDRMMWWQRPAVFSIFDLLNTYRVRLTGLRLFDG